MKLCRILISLVLMVCSFGLHSESLYKEYTFRSLTGDQRAYRPGDAITILVFENSSALASADTTTQKKGGINLSLDTSSTSKSANVGLGDTFAGNGKIQRAGKLVAQLTATVQDVAPNGDLFVKGTQLIEVNNEKQQISLTGRIRPNDIMENNTVLSTRLADARISYVGDGILAEKQRPGILTRILSWLGIL